MLEGSRTFNASFVYCNLLGNEAGRAIFDGGTLIATAGKTVAEGPRLSFAEHLVTLADVSVTAGKTTAEDASGGSVVVDAGPAETATSAGKITVGVDHASKVEIGKRDNTVMTRVNGLAEVHTLKIGEHDQSGTLNKRLKITTPEVKPPALYPSAIWSFDVYLPGAQFHDQVHVSFGSNLGDVTGRVLLTGHVIAKDVVRVVLSNPGHNEVIEDVAAGAYDITCSAYN